MLRSNTLPRCSCCAKKGLHPMQLLCQNNSRRYPCYVNKLAPLPWVLSTNAFQISDANSDSVGSDELAFRAPAMAWDDLLRFPCIDGRMQIYCGYCQCTLNGADQYETHLRSIFHARRVLRERERQARARRREARARRREAPAEGSHPSH